MMMAFQYRKTLDNISCIDTNFFGFPRFNAAYLVRGEKLALIDTGAMPTIDYVRAEFDSLGVTVKDISYIFVTHTEHPDHSGNVGALALENPELKIVCNPNFTEYLTHPEKEAAERQSLLPPGMPERFGSMIPVDENRFYPVKDGEAFDLGGGEVLKVIFAPGHQPSGIIIEEKKNNGVFINDLPGQYFAEFDMSLILTPDRADPVTAMKELHKLEGKKYDWLFLGHYGICDNPEMVIQGALSRMERLMAIAQKCDAEGRLDELKPTIMELVVKPEVDKLRRLREDSFYVYYRDELGPNLCNGFSRFYEKYRKNEK
jgi:glyoxylase-like metal-dependent hydrolase (beta-lactamase superfamily II)